MNLVEQQQQQAPLVTSTSYSINLAHQRVEEAHRSSHSNFCLIAHLHGAGALGGGEGLAAESRGSHEGGGRSHEGGKSCECGDLPTAVRDAAAERGWQRDLPACLC
jgi:hypothetical protein